MKPLCMTNCRTCGAALDPRGSHCSYCGRYYLVGELTSFLPPQRPRPSKKSPEPASKHVSYSGSDDTYVGIGHGRTITTGESNIAIGYQAGAALVDGEDNTFVGHQAGDVLTNVSASYILKK